MTVVKPFGKDAAKMARYMDFLKAAVVSGLLNAPRLAPYVIYAYSPGQAFGEVDDVYSWLLTAGVRVVPHRLSFEDRLTDEAVSQEANLNVGCWVRLDIASLVADQLAQEFEQLGIDTGYVLYTDADVMLAGDFPPHERLTYCRGCAGYPEPACCGERLPPGRPEWFLAGSDADMLPYQMNSGVMYLNVSRMAREMPRLVDYASSKNWAFPNKDNGLLAMYFTRGRPTTDSEDKFWDQFDDALYNSRAFMRRAGRSALIWHWHGFKPADVRCWLRELEAGRMQQFVFNCSDKSLNNKLANDQVAKDPCSYYLHVQLLGQYERLLAIAGRIEEYLA